MWKFGLVYDDAWSYPCSSLNIHHAEKFFGVELVGINVIRILCYVYIFGEQKKSDLSLMKSEVGVVVDRYGGNEMSWTISNANIQYKYCGPEYLVL